MKLSRVDVVEFHDFLRNHGLVFACAESCTGGLVAQQITSVPGASQVFWGGVVTYSNDAKTRLLGVDPGWFDRAGAVSPEVAQAMATGLVGVSGASLAVSLTGVAGPDGGTDAKPVGTVWVGLAGTTPGRRAEGAGRIQLTGDRPSIQEQAAYWSLKMAKVWWESGMDLDSLTGLADNEGKPVVRACSHPILPPPS